MFLGMMVSIGLLAVVLDFYSNSEFLKKLSFELSMIFLGGLGTIVVQKIIFLFGDFYHMFYDLLIISFFLSYASIRKYIKTKTKIKE